VRSPESLSGAIPESIRDPTLDLLRRISRTTESISEKQVAGLAS
jgi:hypothetical protein